MILVTGGSSTIGRHLNKYIPDALYVSSSDYDLTNQRHVQEMFKTFKPDILVHLAARVGGIQDNIKHPDSTIDKILRSI